MTSIVLLRHAAHDWLGRGLAGRLPGVGLSTAGQAQARALVRRLQDQPLAAIHSSPQQRTLETVEPLARQRGLAVQVDAAFDEIDFGAWTGLRFDEVRLQAEAWKHWVERRGSAQPPGGEPFAAVAERAMAGLHRLAARHPGQQVLVASHGDVVKAIVATVLGLSLDHLERFVVAPASVSIVVVEPAWAQLQLLNATELVRPGGHA